MYATLVTALLTLSSSHLAHAAPGSCRPLKDAVESKGWWDDAWNAPAKTDTDPSSAPAKPDWVVTPEWCKAQGIDANGKPKVKKGEVVQFDGHFWDGKSWWTNNGGDDPDHSSSSSGYDGGKDEFHGYQGGKPSPSKGAYAATSSTPARPSGVYGKDGRPSDAYPAAAYLSDPAGAYADGGDWETESHGSWPRPSKAPWGNFSTSASRVSSWIMSTTSSRTRSKMSSSTLSSVFSSSRTSSAVSSSFTSSVRSSTFSSSIATSSKVSSSSSFSSAFSTTSSSSSRSSSASLTSSSSSMTSSASSSTITSSVVSSSTTSSAISSSSSVSGCPPKPTCPTGKYAIQQVAPLLYAKANDDFYFGSISREVDFEDDSTTLASASSFHFVFDSQCRCRLSADNLAGSLSGVHDSQSDRFVDHVFRLYPPGALAAAGGVKESIVTCSVNPVGLALSCTAIDSNSAEGLPNQSVLYNSLGLRIGDNSDGAADGNPQNFVVVPIV